MEGQRCCSSPLEKDGPQQVFGWKIQSIINSQSIGACDSSDFSTFNGISCYEAQILNLQEFKFGRGLSRTVDGKPVFGNDIPMTSFYVDFSAMKSPHSTMQ
ncbi:unnamed protein product [Calypogeia fissa]